MSSFYGVVPCLLASVALFAYVFSHLAHPIACILDFLPLFLPSSLFASFPANMMQSRQGAGQEEKSAKQAGREGRKQVKSQTGRGSGQQGCKQCGASKVGKHISEEDDPLQRHVQDALPPTGPKHA